MAVILAYAEGSDLSGSDWQVILLALAVIGGTAFAALVPIGISRRRIESQTQGIAVLALVWALLTAGSTIWTLMARAKWSREQQMLLRTGYYSGSQDAAGAPAFPWWLLAILAASYLLLVGAALRQRRT